MTKVCHITTVHPRFDTRIFHKECKSLLAAGYDVNLIVADGKGDAIVDGIKIFDLGKPKNRRERFSKFSKLALEKALQIDAQIYHYHDPELGRIALKLKKRGKKVIYDIHEDLPKQVYHKEYLPKCLVKLISQFVKHYEEKIIRRVDYNIVVTHFIYERVSKLTDKVAMVRNFPIFEEKQIDWTQKAANAIAYVGGLSESRGLFDMLETINLLYGKVILHLAGNFYNKQTELKAKSHPGWKYVKYYGFVNKPQVEQILSIVRLGLVPMRKTPQYLEIYPVKMFEYMNMGLPFIYNDIPFWKKLVSKCNCGVSVDTQNYAQFAHLIVKMLEDERTLREMGSRGYQAVKEQFNWQNEEKTLLSVYKKLLT